jgi:3-deoxy-D-manno-octulosonic-acid transferase
VRFLYDALLILGLILSSPMILWKMIKYKKYRHNFLDRLGFRRPSLSLKGPCVWVHAVSLGETKAATALIKQIQKERPDLPIVFSSSTETGLQEGKKNLAMLAAHFLLPLDFSWTMKALAKQINPQLLILVESDFWYNLISSVKTVVLINGKISERSTRRFKFFSFFTKRIFSLFKLLCVQSDLYKKRFTSLGIPSHQIVSTGNLKLDQVIPVINLEKGREQFGLTLQDRVITLGSTHHPEEEELLEALDPLFSQFPHLKILLVPRHPERFSSVTALLEKKGLPFARYSDPRFLSQAKQAQVIFIDAMGLLETCYQLSEIAVVGGSFISHVGGHNIFEPVSVGVPVLFGPHMQAQKELVDLALSYKVGHQVTLLTLPQIVKSFLEAPPLSMHQRALELTKKMQGSTQRTWDNIRPFV